MDSLKLKIGSTHQFSKRKLPYQEELRKKYLYQHWGPGKNEDGSKVRGSDLKQNHKKRGIENKANLGKAHSNI